MYRMKFYPHILYLFVVLTTSVLGQHHVNFTHLSPSSNSRAITVNRTLQDGAGNIWMVQQGDLYIYDGYNYKKIDNQTIFPSTKQYQVIRNLIIDEMNHIWAVSNGGLLTQYNPIKGIFEDLSPHLNNKKASVITTGQGKVWLATKNGSIYKYSNSTMDSITTVKELDTKSTAIADIAIGASNEVFLSTGNGNIYVYYNQSNTMESLVAPFNNYPENLKLTTDRYNRLWIGTETNGLYLYDIATKEFIQDSFFKGDIHNIKGELFLDLYCDSTNFLWAGTDGGGLYKVNLTTGEVLLFTKQSTNEFSLSSNTILNINEDNHQNIWIVPNYGSLNILPNANNQINYHEGSANHTPTRTLSIHRSSDHVLWAGTDGSGLTKITFNPDGSTNDTQFFNDALTGKGFYIQTMTEDRNGNLWIGTYKNGLWYYDSKAKSFNKIPVFNNKNQQASDVRTVYTDHSGRIWVGSNTCLNIYSDSQELLASFEYNTNNLKGSIVESIMEGQNGMLWLGVYDGGLFQFNENHNNLRASTFMDHSILNENLDRIKSVKYISEGTYNSLWLINDIGKLLKYDIKNQTFTSFEHIRALSDRSLAAVINVGNDNLWISTSNGIINYNPKDTALKTYYITDGLQDNVFLSRSAFKDYTGALYFGGAKGLNYFYPNELFKQESRPNLQISSIEVLNQPAEVLLPDQVGSGIADVPSLHLKYNQSSFSFRFAALDNILYPKHFYAYRLKGFDNDWIKGHQERSATYTNIPAGTYTFEVKAGTKDDVWDVPTKSITIAIEQPFWNKPMAWLFYFCVFLLMAYAVRRWYVLKKKLFVERMNHQNENEMHAVKMNFFAKMSHEIQTPLTLILGPIDEMIKNADKSGNLLLKQRLNIIAYNTKRLSKIAYELTLVRNKELDKIRLAVIKSNLSKNIDDIGRSFRELARHKHIDFTVNCPQDLNAVWYDQRKIEHIIYNLLSNAFKFSPKEGHVILTLATIKSGRMAKISVKDSGPGIPKEELDTIFELFYQANDTNKSQGTGIGLALTKELVDLHKGKIEVESSALNGTTFTITFPIQEDAYSDSERITTDHDETAHEALEDNMTTLETTKHPSLLKKTILIVEDTIDLQLFLKELLQDDYNIILAENGMEGYHYAKSNLPDLILSDIMMPELDGIEMSKQLQENALTKHIPIVLLTAKNSTHSKIEGLKSGAIEYINKPFNTKELRLKIQNILASREHIISKYRKEVISNPEVPIGKTQDEIFLENLVANINLRLEDADFKIDELAIPLNMSYSSMYRKCRYLTGKSLVDFVRLLRLKKAAILLTKQGYTISEAAFMTGFNDPKYFSKCFKNEFNKTPGDFKKEAQKMGVDTYLSKHEAGSFL